MNDEEDKDCGVCPVWRHTLGKDINVFHYNCKLSTKYCDINDANISHINASMNINCSSKT